MAKTIFKAQSVKLIFLVISLTIAVIVIFIYRNMAVESQNELNMHYAYISEVQQYSYLNMAKDIMGVKTVDDLNGVKDAFEQSNKIIDSSYNHELINFFSDVALDTKTDLTNFADQLEKSSGTKEIQNSLYNHFAVTSALFMHVHSYYAGTESEIRNEKELIEYLNEIYNSNIDAPQMIIEGEYNSALEQLYKGKMDGINFGIGADAAEIINLSGEPNQKSNFMGGLLLSYDETFFLTDGNILNDTITYGDVTGVYYTGERTIYGVHKGMPLEEVKEILGEPNDTYIAYSSELYEENNLIIKYGAGEYTVLFEMDDEDKTVRSISIWRNEKC